MTDAVTWAVCTFASVSPRTTSVDPVCTVYSVSGVPAEAGQTSLVMTLNVFGMLFSYPPKAIAKAVAEASAAAAALGSEVAAAVADAAAAF